MASELRISTLDELTSALDQAASAAEVEEIAQAWQRSHTGSSRRYGKRLAFELIYDALRAFDRSEVS